MLLRVLVALLLAVAPTATAVSAPKAKPPKKEPTATSADVGPSSRDADDQPPAEKPARRRPYSKWPTAEPESIAEPEPAEAAGPNEQPAELAPDDKRPADEPPPRDHPTHRKRNGKQAPAKHLLSHKQLQLAEAAVTAYYQSNTLAVLAALSALVEHADQKHLDALDELLASQQVPPAAGLLAEGHLSLVNQGFSNKLHKPHAHELLLLLPPLHDAVQRIVAQHEQDPLNGDELPASSSMQADEKLFWSIHVLKNRLLGAERAAEYGAELVKGFPRGHRAKLSEEQKAALDADYAALADGIRRRLVDFEERTIELRLARLKAALAILKTKELTEERVLAMFAADMDGRLVTEFLEQPPPKGKHKRDRFGRAALNDPDLLAGVRSDVESAAELSGDLMEKSKLLMAGLHWWLRGRYGQGPDAGGLAKSAAALSSPEAMLALYMPATMPVPTDPGILSTGMGPVPQFDRRHHYWWAWEDRRVETMTKMTVNKPGAPTGGVSHTVNFSDEKFL